MRLCSGRVPGQIVGGLPEGEEACPCDEQVDQQGALEQPEEDHQHGQTQDRQPASVRLAVRENNAAFVQQVATHTQSASVLDRLAE